MAATRWTFIVSHVRTCQGAPVAPSEHEQYAELATLTIPSYLRSHPPFQDWSIDLPNGCVDIQRWPDSMTAAASPSSEGAFSVRQPRLEFLSDLPSLSFSALLAARAFLPFLWSGHST